MYEEFSLYYPYYGDTYGLDGDNDGAPCENLATHDNINIVSGCMDERAINYDSEANVMCINSVDNTLPYHGWGECCRYLYDSPSGTTSHKYSTPGIKTIKSIVFSYVDIPNTFEFQILRWKLVTSKIFLGTSKVYREEFSDLGGADFTTIP